MRVTATYDPTSFRLVKLDTHIQWMEQRREIWMDGRPHPPDFDAHTWQGFSTGTWEGSVLVVETSHLKAGWIRRNGLALSDRARMTERFFRHGDLLTHTSIIQDPVYLTEPLVRTNGFRLTTLTAIDPYPCQPAVEVERDPTVVPHHLPGRNPYLGEFAKRHNLPLDATRGGAETSLPEFAKQGRGPARPITAAMAAPTRDANAAPRVQSKRVQGNVWMITTGSANVAVQIGDDGVLVVDTGPAATADAVLAEIRRLAGDKPIRFIVNTHAHADHVGGNAVVAKAGRSIIAGNFAPQAGAAAANAAKIYAHELTHRRMSGEGPAAVTSDAWPTDTFFTERNDLYFNGEAVQLLHVPNGHAGGDVMVYFRKSDVIVAGDLYINTTFPVIEQDGSLNGILAGLNRIIQLTVPKQNQEGGTYVIPGHGRLADEADVVEYRDMVTIIRDRILDALQRKQTLDQVKAARLVRDYEGRYGAAEGSWTTDAFVTAAYRSVAR